MNEVFSQVLDCIGSNHMYMRLASTEMFAISYNVVQKMISGGYDSQKAFEEFSTHLPGARNIDIPDYNTRQNTGYEYAFGEHGSQAASAVINTLRRQCGDDIAVAYAGLVTSSVFAGDYNYDQINRLLCNNEYMHSGKLTGAEVKLLMEWLVNVKEDGSNPIRHKNLIPVTGGMEYEITDNGDGTYTLGCITIDRKPLDESKEYSASLFGDITFIEESIYCNCPMPEILKSKLEMKEENVYTIFRTALEDSRQLEKPTEYISVHK